MTFTPRFFFRFICLALSFSVPGFAQGAESDGGTASTYIQMVPGFTWDFVLGSEQVKSSDTHDVNGIYTSAKTSLLYSLSEHDDLRLYGSFVHEAYWDYKNSSYPELGELMYRRKAILNTQDHGLDLHFELKHAQVLDSEIRRRWGFNSETIPQLILKRRIPGVVSLEAKVRHHFYHRNSSKPSTLDNEDRLYLSASKMLSPNLIANTGLKYRRQNYLGPHYSYQRGGFEDALHEDLTIHPGVMYLVNRRLMLEGYVETKLMESFDERPIGRLMGDELVFGAALYLTVL